MSGIERKCARCDSTFVPHAPHHMFCGNACRNMYNRSATWLGYFKSLISKGPARKKLSASKLVSLLEAQKGLCALSGIELTRIHGRGVVNTNASLDRIVPGGPYVMKNIRIVCTFVNSFRGAVSDNELVWWCQNIVKHNGST
jgi:hypothetical protein